LEAEAQKGVDVVNEQLADIEKDASICHYFIRLFQPTNMVFHRMKRTQSIIVRLASTEKSLMLFLNP
jgi:hypothetical protein